MVLRRDVEFPSSGATLRGWLFEPVRRPAPGIVMAHGLSAVKEMFLDDYAVAFADAGFGVLAYDHFGFGDSGGDPRQLASPGLQLQGYRDAVAWVAGRPEIDSTRIGIWGSSFSGGQVIILASEDLPIRCGVAQVPALGDGGPDLPAAGRVAMSTAIASGDEEAVLPAVTGTPDGLGLMYEDGAADWFARVAAHRAPAWRNELRASGFAEPFRPIDHLTGARVPLLLVVAIGDTLTPPGPGLSVAASVPNIDVVELPGGHFDAYEAGFEASSGAAVKFFERHLCG